MLEYNLEFRPTNLVKGQGLAKMMAQSNCEVLGMNFLALCSEDIAQVEEKQVHLGKAGTSDLGAQGSPCVFHHSPKLLHNSKPNVNLEVPTPRSHP